MNKSNISKLKLFLMGLENRFEENKSIFKHITITYTAGLKNFKGIASLEDDNLNYNFNGRTNSLTIGELFKEVIKEAENYESVTLTYSERGEAILITCDNKNVTMKNIDIDEKELFSPSDNSNKKNKNFHGNTSTILNRDYYIKVGKADALLKEIGIMSKEGKIKNDKIRKYNQIDHYVELLEGILDDLPKNTTINILDCGCGKSYLSFVLNYYLTEVKKRKCHFIGLDYSEGVIESSKKMAQNLGYRNMEFHAIDIKNYVPDKKIHVVISLHACDTATDMALALGIKVDSDIIIAVPCCHREMLEQYSFEPFKSILKHGIFKARMADILTDGMRSLMLEAKGYDVSVVEYISPLETPKNLMIRAIKKKDEDPRAMDEYMSLLSNLNVYPALYSFLNEW
ncbi:MAG: SAM-dependent methyltransferase [Clostridium argentinense]|uniref:SAM-dependent methyltransferase n=1 Tax=Clostridium faecium TaxID=2762223 RepID=A0ABR8YX73_9CLOT|nr:MULTISPECIES: SAM-dependent methyltransferase [Clostridium]MBD8048887.1 SAM-dependent methyltransferase [Clostridium faecium]MBS5824201.1 SAM-dependent methyltransferase [Clostridium argentinense]MDU1350810.1 SAM-dependent methyltransferase [Clostridium argentinense]